MTDRLEIDITIKTIIKKHSRHSQICKDDNTGFEVAGTIPTMQDKQKVDGFYFANTIPKEKDCRLYFFPIYTDVEHFENIDPVLRKCLKGKSCFHIKKLDSALQNSIEQMIIKGIAIYQEKGLVSSLEMK